MYPASGATRSGGVAVDARLVDVENAAAGVEMGAKADAVARRVAATMSFMIDVVLLYVDVSM